MNRRPLIRFFIILIVMITVFSFASCKDDKNEESTTGYSYNPVGSETTEVPSTDSTAGDVINIDDSWMKNFHVKYRYYNPEQSVTTMNIEEKKSAGAFTVEYLDTNSILYYKANGMDTDYYVIINNEEEQVHSVLKNKKFSSLSSMFMKLSEVNADLPTQSNVLYMYDEEVAGRNCHKYIQRAYSDGKLTQSVYVWIDVQYGFAARCEAYDESNNLTLMWDIESFETGTLTDEDVFIDISEYAFKENVG
ncbi:MAG: hypothetical protein E7573_00140 [Ruminococcaceae bacterium]|nr:hypothetical protein [Oscillospiraceae bacterium]MBR3595759.1 hypothetical protein [Clostridia bacterium]